MFLDGVSEWMFGKRVGIFAVRTKPTRITR